MTPSAPAPPGHVALIGMMGSGKSRVGRLVARELGRPFVDLDQSIEIAAAADIPEIFDTRGEVGFRKLETAQLAKELARSDPIVLATGGGVVLRETNRLALVARATGIWLRATPETLGERVQSGSGRPLLVGTDPRVELSRLLDEREPLYAGVADLVVDVDQLGLREATSAVVAGVAEAVR